MPNWGETHLMSRQTAIVRSLREALGDENVSVDEADLASYARDALGPGRGYPGYSPEGYRPWVGVRPETTEQVAAIVKLAQQHRVPVVPYGGGTGLMGGALSLRGGIVVDLQRMDRILAISREDRAATVQAGVVLQALHEALQEHGLMLGHDPWSLPVATVGGAISTNGLGYGGAKYGSMGDQVLGLEAVLPNGEVLRTKGVPKASVGIALKHLFIGAEGTIGLITEATLRVFPQPERRLLCAFQFPSFEAGFETIVKLFDLGLRPSLLDYGEENPSIRWEGPAEGDPFHLELPTLYLALEGFQEEVEAQGQRARAICAAFGGKDLGPDAAEHFWEARHIVAERYARNQRRAGGQSPPSPQGRRKVDYVHVALPTSQVLPYRQQCRSILEEYGLALRDWGLWTQPELFSVVMVDMGLMDNGGDNRLSEAVDRLLKLAQDRGGSMEYCHGVGLRLAHLMAPEHGFGLDLMRRIKRALDPHNLMNPGKLGL